MAAAALPTIRDRGIAAGVELAAQGVIAAIGVAGAVALLNRTPGAARLAAIGVILSMCRVVQSLYWSGLPVSTAPGQAPYAAALALVPGVVALVILARLERVGHGRTRKNTEF